MLQPPRRWELEIVATPQPWGTPEDAAAAPAPAPAAAPAAEGGSSAASAAEPRRELSFTIKLRRVRSPEPGETLAPLSVWAHLELADRWSNWQRATLAPGEEFEYDLGDRRLIHTLRKWQVAALPSPTQPPPPPPPPRQTRAATPRGLRPGSPTRPCWQA